MSAAVQVTLLWSGGCPNSQEAESRVRRALEVAGLPPRALTVRQVETWEEAEQLCFRGSPTVLVDGTDPFAEPSDPVALACRVYRTAEGTEGAPSVTALVEAVRTAIAGRS